MVKSMVFGSGRRRAAILGAAALVGAGAWVALPSGAATNNGLTITPGSGSTISGALTFSAPAPGCGAVPQAVVRIKGTGIAGDLADDPGFTNITPAQSLESPSAAISLNSGGDTWENIAINKSIPRPLTGTYTVKIQCLEDGESAGKPFFDRDVVFTGQSFEAVGQTSPSPTPVPSPTPTPSPDPSTTPTPSPDPSTTPTPTPNPSPSPSPSPAPTPTPTPTPSTTPAPGPKNSASQTLPAGGILSTNTTVTQTDPIGTSVTSPVAGAVTISEANTTANPPAGYSFFGQQVSITAPAATAAAPLKLQFRLDASLINGGSIPTVFRNGSAVPACTNLAAAAASPNPCVEPHQNLGNGDILLTVRTSEASLWNFGRRVDAKPPTDVASVCRAGGPVPSGWNLIQGTSGDDVLIGTPGPDIIRGLNGSDTLVGGGSSDLICGGSGDDLISGNTGHDLLLGDTGDDAIYGGSGDDALGGGAGNDNLNGGLGNDLLSGGSGHDLMFGGRDNDRLYGDAGNDRMYGEDGYDRLYGGPGIDVLVVGRRF